MNIKIVSVAENALQIQIDKEDYSLADIVHRELLNVKHVKFAGVPPPHPLLKTLTVQVHTDGTAPMKLVNEALDLAKNKVSVLLKEANEVFPREPRELRPNTGSSIELADTENVTSPVEDAFPRENSVLKDEPSPETQI